MDVRRVRTAKRRKEEKLAGKNQIHLERVLGLTILSNAGLACSPTTGTIAYPAGCTIVLYNARKNRQFFITNPSRKTFTTLDFSEDGNYMVTGECGHQPHVRVWDVHDRSLVVEFPGHKYGINCVSFAPNGKYVVSVGSQHDMIVNVWDWRGNTKVASNKISAKVKAVSFAENGNYFVTAGNRHVKFWYLEYSRSKYQEPTPLTGRSAILGEQRNNYFCDVACGRGEMGDSTFAITKSGLLCEFNNRRLLDKWVELRTPSANCLTVGEDFIFIGCADGIIRCFSPHTLQFVTTLPRTHYLGVDVSKGLTISHMASHPQTCNYPDATAIAFDKSNFKVTVIYNDHSIYIWDVRDINKVGKSHSFLFHSACIWGLEMYPVNSESQKSVLPQGSFVTCSSDDTIRIWNLANNMANNTVYKRNIYSEELLKMIYVDPGLEFIKDGDPCKMDTDQKETSTVYDQRNGVRCIRISPDGKHLASGDRAGNVRIHELQFMDEMCKIEAHDAEVLCLEYSNSVPVPNSKRSKSLLASASRDRLIHVFNATRDYGFQHTLDDHSSSITAIRFLKNPQSPSTMQMISCGADKSIIFRDISVDEKGQPDFQRVNHIVGKTTLYDMEIDYDNQQILTACQDRNIRVYAVDSGKHSKTFKGSQSEDGTLIKVVLDQSGSYAATSCTDKTLAIYDYITGEVAATMFGHSELVTGLRFTHDCKHLVSVSGDGCIFIWRLPVAMTANMLNRLQQLNGNPSVKISQKPSLEASDNNGDYNFNVGQLPVWAKKQIGESTDSNQNSKAFKGRWGAPRDGESVVPFQPPSELDNGAANGGGSKESSLEVGQTLPGRKGFTDDYLNDEDYNSMSEIEYNRHTPFSQGIGRPGIKGNRVIHLKANSRPASAAVTDADSSLGSLNIESTAEHDGDIDEYSDGLTTHDDGGESTEPEHPDKTLFFAQQHEQTPASEYPVNAINTDELQRARRGRSSRAKSEPSQESDMATEDDEASTPSAEHAERNVSSMLSAVSTENVDLLGRRAQFMKSNFDSLSGAEDPKTGQNTISNRYREGSAVQRNAATIARAQSFRDQEQNKRRELLQKRIEETRRKLQDIGYRSMMRGSQSISDLTNTTDTARFMVNNPDPSQFSTMQGLGSRPTSTEPPPSHVQPRVQPDTDGGLRRVCSLSDLTKSSSQRRLLPAPPISVSGKKSPAKQPQQQQRPVIQQQLQPQGRLRKTSRSENLASPSAEDLPSYMRSTSASTKKERSAVMLTPLGGARRPSANLGQAQSTSDLRQIAPDDDSSSEEDNSSLSSSRRRSNSHDRRNGIKGKSSKMGNPALARSDRDLTKVTKVRVRSSTTKDSESKPRPKMKTTTMIVSNEPPPGVNRPASIDVVHEPLDWRLVEQTRATIQEASDNLVQLYKRISLDHALDEGMRHRFLQDLVTSAEVSQATLRPLTTHEYRVSANQTTITPIAPNKGPSWC